MIEWVEVSGVEDFRNETETEVKKCGGCGNYGQPGYGRETDKQNRRAGVSLGIEGVSTVFE